MQKDAVQNIYEIISKGVKSGIGQLYTEDNSYDKTTITFGNKRHVNFGSYSYLGLELDSRLKNGAKNAIDNYGIQFPSSRTYMSSTPYKEFESLLEQMFEAPIIIATTTTLAHVATMPIVVNEGDIIIMDQQVHSSVQFMVSHLQNSGVPFQVVRHNNLESLEQMIQKFSKTYDRVWYMIDGVYSMYGDVAPMKELEVLLDKYPKFHLYCDDAHGMSWSGKNGTGYALSEIDLHEKMILVTSLNKAFAAGGALVVMKDQELSDLVKTCGGPFIFAGQHQMSALGAGIACAKIHLSDEIYALQYDLKLKIAHCQKELESYGLPIVSSPESPIFFVGVGLPRVGYNLVKKMLDSGQYVNLAIFPAVAETRTGVRFTITTAHSFEQITVMAQLLSENFKKALIEEERTLEDIHKAFRRENIFKGNSELLAWETKLSKFTLQREESISKIPKDLWNSLLGDSTLDWDALVSLERAFSSNKLARNKWKFVYYIVNDEDGTPVVASYFTNLLAKDDALAPAQVSYQIEQERKTDPTYLCSKTYMMGCPLSVGNHLYLDRDNLRWKNAFNFFLEAVRADHEAFNTNVLNLRDFNDSDQELKSFILDQGFIKAKMLDNFSILDVKPFSTPNDYLQELKSSHRYFIRKRALRNAHLFETKIHGDDTNASTLNSIYTLYKNIKDKSYELNLFDYPVSLFKEALTSNSWDVMTLNLKGNSAPVALAMSVKTKNHYNFIIAGLDYDAIEEHDVYSQLLWQILLRANELGCSQINLGLTTGQNKMKFGATRISQDVFVQLNDSYNAGIIAAMSNSRKKNLNKLLLHKENRRSED